MGKILFFKQMVLEKTDIHIQMNAVVAPLHSLYKN